MDNRVWCITNKSIGLVYESVSLLTALQAAFNEEARMATDRITAVYTTADPMHKRFMSIVSSIKHEDTTFNAPNVLNVARMVAKLQQVSPSHLVMYYQAMLNDLEEMYDIISRYRLETVIQA